MSNMSYCRFTNTLSDLEECYEHMDDENLGDEETRSRKELIRVCMNIAQDYQDEIED